MRKDNFVEGECYHIYNRTIANYRVFSDERNAKYLLRAFLLANSTKSSEAFKCLRNNQPKATFDVAFGLGKALETLKQGEKIVDLLCFAIMQDHYHLLLKERRENGIIDFVRKCDISISKYINIRNNRRGSLFESRFKSKHIDSNEYLVHSSVYMHLNPLDIISGKEWREHKLQNWEEIRKPIFDYPWSSLKSFFEPSSENSLLSGQEIITEQFKNKEEYEEFLKDWSMPDFFTDNEFE